MSRRKQANPQHFESDDELAEILQNGSSFCEEDDDEHICGKCRADFDGLSEFLRHKKRCTRRQLVLVLPDEKNFPVAPSSEDEDEMDCDEPPSLVKGSTSRFPDDDCPKRTLVSNSKLPHFTLLHSIPDTHVALETLQNTRVAVAQHGHPARAAELGALQSALYTLQQQQLLQLQIIQQLHQHILGTNSGSAVAPQLTGTAALTPPQSTDGSSGGAPQPLVTTTTASQQRLDAHSSSQVIQNHPPPPLPPPPPPQEPNTLELLQRHTEQALQNTMSGGSFLLNGISSFGDGQYSKKKNGDGDDKPGEDGLFRHRCRFCGKVFGSDSALQIHVRSHTGERPFKCNVCGNRFTTKGNLKVHFQRHKAKYPHIRMHGEPVPEHLDSLHPPLEPPTSNGSDSPVLSNVPLDVSDVSTGAMAQDLSVRTGGNGGRDTPPIRSYSPNDCSNLTAATDCSDDGSEDAMDLQEGDVLKQEELVERYSSPEPRSPEKRDDHETLADDDDELAKDDEDGCKRSESREGFVGFSKLSSFTSYLGTSNNFPSFFHPSPFSAISPFTFATATPTTTFAPSTSHAGTQATNTSAAADGGRGDIPTDPSFYQDLLPKPGSNDNTWESLMEITKPSETSKLQQLVDNIENKLSDPNQCIICHRVLSCKSALQMHYRTHTGERPFKCKICGRAFTTKGNLKTHMGVHRVKPPLRVLHQCPVCHKQFTNSLVLQQHIRMHTGEPVDMLPEHIMANEIKMAPMLPASFQRPPPMLALMPPSEFESPVAPDDSNSCDDDDMEDKQLKEEDERPISPSAEDSRSPPSLTSPPPKVDSPSPPPPVTSAIVSPTNLVTTMVTTESPIMIPRSIPIPVSCHPVSYPSTIFSTSLAALENHVKTINTSVPQPLPFGPFGIALPMGGPYPRYDDPMYFSRSHHHHHHPMELSVNRGGDKSPLSHYSSSPTTSRAASEGSIDERSTPGIKSDSPLSVVTSKSDGALDLTPRASVLSVSQSLTPTSLSPGLFPPMLKGLPFPPTATRSTTCRICFKTFACHSALEIHYRSHTKERPFKCTVCDRGFSTRGNMKQHMLTHKIRDLPSQLFTTTTTTPSPTFTEKRPETPPPPIVVPVAPDPPAKSEAAATAESPKCASESNSALGSGIKRPSGMPKHMCFICNKPFSSASALQIHNRTHTGDKPFKCTICGRAFTTKGNLKVHMGTHMWNNGSSRRGRRMSLDLPPLPLPPPSHSGKPGEMMSHHHSDLYFQYLSPNFMNGMTPPKMNEISVIQSAAGMTNGLYPPPHMRSHLTSPPKNGDFQQSLEESTAEKKTTSPVSGSDPGGHRSPEIRAPMVPTWGWKIACNVCNKICSSSADLEIHLKTHHFKKEAKEISEPPQVAEHTAA